MKTLEEYTVEFMAAGYPADTAYRYAVWAIEDQESC